MAANQHDATEVGTERVLIEPGPTAVDRGAAPASWDEVERVVRGTVGSVEAVRRPGDPDRPGRTEWRIRATTADGPVDAVLIVVPARSPEAVGYGSGLLDALPGDGLRAPHLRAVVERPDQMRALWIDDVTGTPIAACDPARRVLAAEHLGRLQGSYLSGAAHLPQLPGLAHDHVAVTVESHAADFADFRPFTATAEERRVVPAATLRAAERVWRERAAHLRRVAALPRTLDHHTLGPDRLIAADQGAGEPVTVAVGWHSCGVGGVGHDLATWVMEAGLDGTVAPDAIPAELEALLAGYCRGLTRAGAPLSEAEVRFAVAAHATIAYAWVPAALLGALANDGGAGAPIDARLTGSRRDEAIEAWAAAAALWYELGRYVAEHEPAGRPGA